MMDENQSNADFEIAGNFAEKGDFKEAERYYRKALGNANPVVMQTLIERINEMKAKAKTAPKLDKMEEKQKELNFKAQAVRFRDIIGYERQKRLARRIIELPIKRGGLFTKFRMPKSTGIILYGPPGTGKTLFTKAISGEFNLPMKDIFISDILDRLVGGSEKNMKKAFEDAKACQPSLLFFDELDALGAARENSNEFASNEIKNTINEFLKQTSELHDSKETKVFVVGATNLPWLVDEAIKRSGRLEHFIYMSPPNLLDRMKLFDYYLERATMDFAAYAASLGATDKDLKWNKKVFKEEHRKYLANAKKEGHKVNTLMLSLATCRYSGADIEKVCTGAKRRAIEADRGYVTTHDIQKVIRDKQEGASSLDSWVLQASKTYIKSSKTITHRTGFMGWRKKKEKIEEQGKLTDGELKVYKPLISNIKSNLRWWWAVNCIRFIAQGM